MESHLIRRLAEALGRAEPPPYGIGDDGALLREADGRVVVMDTVAEGTHFRLDWSSVSDAAFKAIAVNVSDIWAMGAEPSVWLLSLGLPAEMANDVVLSSLIEGFEDARDQLVPGLELVGGDTVRTPAISLTVTMIGHQIAPLRRDAAQPGQGIWVNGDLGLARAGLQLLEQGRVGESGPLIAAHRRPVPRRFDPMLASQRGATAGMDVSDGLAADLRRLCAASRCGAEVSAPLPGLETLLRELGGEEAELGQLQLLGGEDFVQLLTCETRPGPEFLRIGTVVTADLGLTVIGPDGSRQALPEAGFEHFS